MQFSPPSLTIKFLSSFFQLFRECQGPGSTQRSKSYASHGAQVDSIVHVHHSFQLCVLAFRLSFFSFFFLIFSCFKFTQILIVLFMNWYTRILFNVYLFHFVFICLQLLPFKRFPPNNHLTQSIYFYGLFIIYYILFMENFMLT